MITTGIKRKIDTLGRIVVPKEIRNDLKMTENETMIDIFLEGGYIVLVPGGDGGIKRKLDLLGRIVIPAEIRDTLHLEVEDPMEIFTAGESIYIKKYNIGCTQCGEIKGVKTVGNITICNKCAIALFKMLKGDK